MILAASLVVGVLLRLPGGSLLVTVPGSLLVAITAGLVLAIVLPFAFFASVGRGYLLPISMAILLLMMANLIVVLGWGEYFPWAVPGLYAQGDTVLPPASYGGVILTGLAGMLATYLWWQNADQNR